MSECIAQDALDRIPAELMIDEEWSLRCGDRLSWVGHELRQNPAYSWTPLGEEGERDTWALFQRYDDKEWSYTDCAILALSQREKVPRVFAFDHHFDQMPDIERLPVAG